MNWTKFLTYGESEQKAFEVLCNQLFERYLRRTYKGELTEFRVINSAGGDGGIEAYGQLNFTGIIAVQSKWFRDVLGDSEILQIKKSLTTALALRPAIKEYIICIPRNVGSVKYGRGKKGAGKKKVEHFEEKTINDFIAEIALLYPKLKLTWWFEKDIELELLQSDNEGVQKFWFDREIFSIEFLSKHFSLQKKGWLNERYIPELHAQGMIHFEYEQLCFSSAYRRKLLDNANKASADLKICLNQIDHFVLTNTVLNEINDELSIVKSNLLDFYNEFQRIVLAIKAGNELYKAQFATEKSVWEVKLKLEKLTPTNSQKNILPKLISALDNIHKYNLPQYIEYLISEFNQKIRLILGEAGTGKTHGLAHCVETHLSHNAPAIIIQAKGTANRSWGEILSNALGIEGWSINQIFSALETAALKRDILQICNREVDQESTNELTKVIICVDGLEEDIEKAKDWYARMRECEAFLCDYPRLRILFSARKYFYDNTEVPKGQVFKEITLPREGDVGIDEVAPLYFSKEHFNIQLPSLSLIRGVDSLFALRLFCEEYQNRVIGATEKIVTATRDLINLKIERLNKEFYMRLGGPASQTRSPIMETLEIIAKIFYSTSEIEHNDLVAKVRPVLGDYLNGAQIDALIDYLTDNAFLVRFQGVEEDGVFKRRKFYYSVTYQSLIEHIISEKIYYDISKGSLNTIPVFLHHPMRISWDYNPRKPYNALEISPNEKIIQSIVDRLLTENEILIGEGQFLPDGFDDWEIKKLQLNAIGKAPPSIAGKFIGKVDDLFSASHKDLSYVMEYLILPSTRSTNSTFWTERLHDKLFPLSVFDRDRLWSGLDAYEIGSRDSTEEHDYQSEFTSPVFRAFKFGIPFLSNSSLHNEDPLVFAWALSTIDQSLRNNLRIALAGWAIKNPSEFLLLLSKIFNCNDPQIQEDLASIMLGVASKLKDAEQIKVLANWSIENIFNKLNVHRNVLVRQGFRAIVERGFQFGVITLETVESCRPKPIKKIEMIPFEKDWTINERDGCYPIVHDLAWYVIQKSYNGFLEYPSAHGKHFKDNDCVEAQKLLNKYRRKYKDKDLYASNWTVSVALAYIKSLGLTRTEGNWHTQATHGGKSKIFTYEEKYTWLAVHYLQGYLSDYIPNKRWSDEREFVTDYSLLEHISNPAESVRDIDSMLKKPRKEKEWIIKEVLTKEMRVVVGVNDAITEWVNEEPTFDLEKWLSFDSNDFQIDEDNRKWTALYNRTSLHDSKEFCYTTIDLKACLVKKNDFTALQNVVQANPDHLRFASHLDGLHSVPRTDSYCNPTDIVWMTWIPEDYAEEIFYADNSSAESVLFKTITKVTQNTSEGEGHLMLPSKKVRELIGCYEYEDNELRDSNGRMLAFNYKKSDWQFKDIQEIVLVDAETLEHVEKTEEHKVVWFMELFKQRNPLNESLDKKFHVRKTRKYLVWTEDGKKKYLKFWDEEASNIRDEVRKSRKSKGW